MLRIHQSQSAAAAEKYFGPGLAKESYYHEQEIAGQWHGKLAARLGLAGQVQAEDFRKLVNNRRPDTGGKLTPRDRANRTPAYDFTFSPSKSVSMLYAHTGDEGIVRAHRQAVKETMGELENEIQVRVRKEGKNEDRTTGNMLWAEFVHKTSRPVDGYADPHLHTHAVAINCTYDAEYQHRDGTRGAILAGKFKQIKADAPYYEAAYNSRLAVNLKKLGYEIQRNGRDFEIAGIDRSMINANSRRTQQIDRLADKKGITHVNDKAKLGAYSRAGKEKLGNWEQQRASFRKRLSNQDRTALDAAAQARIKSNDDQLSASRAIDTAIGDRFYGESVVNEKRFLETALRRSVGSVSVEAIHREMRKRRGEFIRAKIDDNQLLTHKTVHQEERKMIQLAKSGRGRCHGLGHLHFEFRPIQAGDGSTFELNKEQKAAVTHLLNSPDKTMIVIGRAGTGKTTLLSEAKRGIEENGGKLHAFAPSTDAVNVLRSEGFKANTLASLLKSEKAQKQLYHSVILIDEAGMVGTQDMKKVLEIANKRYARVILSGDPKQIGSVRRGDALALMESHAGLKPAVVREIQRQKPDEYRQAASHLNEGRIREGYKMLDQLGWVHEVGDEDRTKALAKAYLEATRIKKSNGRFQTAIVVSGTHKEANEVSREIRAGLKAQGRLDQEDRMFSRLAPIHLSDAAKRDPARYERGQIVQFHTAFPGETLHPSIQKGEKLAILGRGSGGKVIARDELGRRFALPFKAAKHFSVYRQEQIPIAKGEILRFTSNTYELGKRTFTNGSFGEVKRFTPQGDIQLADGRIVRENHGHFASGLVSTIDAAQGQSRDHTFLAMSSDSFAVANRERFGVAISRGKYQAHVFTDDKAKLKEVIDQSGRRRAATDLTREAGPLRHRWQQVQRMARRTQSYIRDRYESMKTGVERAKSDYEQFRDDLATKSKTYTETQSREISHEW